ncbi:MAG: hypothetical protein RL722_1202 [Pseudomonadota bacterium]|jgi:hypothetical protein
MTPDFARTAFPAPQPGRWKPRNRWALTLAVTLATTATLPAWCAEASAADHGGHPASASHKATGKARPPATDLAAIRQVLMAQFDRPDARLQVHPVVIEGAHAVAGWRQGERGGRALMKRVGQEWQIALCAGAGLTQASLLKEAGLSAVAADALATKLAKAESALDATSRKRFDSFEGVVKMDAQGHHPPAHAGGSSHGSGATHGGAGPHAAPAASSAHRP